MAGALVWSAIRACLVGAAATAAACPVSRWIAVRGRPIVWALLVLPFLVPALIVGYAWSGIAMRLSSSGVGPEVAYFVVSVLRFTPLAVLALVFAPRGMSDEAWACYRSVRRARNMPCRVRWAFDVRGPWIPTLLAAALVWLVAFGEFEIASRMMVRSWPVTLFDQHAWGTALTQSLRMSVAPLLLRMAVILPCAVVVLLATSWSADRTSPRQPRRGATVFAWSWIAVGFVLGVVAPAFISLPDELPAFARLASQTSFWERTAGSAVFGVAAATCAYALCAATVALSSRLWRVLVAMLCIVGLIGPLVLSLAVLAAFQVPSLRPLRDTPVPLVFVLTLIILPYGIVLRWLMCGRADPECEHSARMLRASRKSTVARRGALLLWDLRIKPRAWVLYLLFCWAYFDLTAGDLLAPVRMQTAPSLLYNQMHYGRTAMLSAMTCVFFALPLLALGVGAAARKVYSSVTAHA